MKYTLVAAALVAAVSAQTLADIPACAIPCLDSAVTSKTNCETTDIACVCKNFDVVQGAATPCVISKCGAEEALSKVLPASQALCKDGGAGGNPPPPPAKTTTKAAPPPPAQSSTYAPPPAGETTTAAAPPPETTTTPCSTLTTIMPSGPSKPSNGTVTTSGVVTVPTGGAAALGSIGAAAMLGLAALAL